MSLIKCNECGKEISDTVKTCPNCGYKNKTNSKKIVIIAAIVAAIFTVLAIGFGLYELYGKSNGNKPKGVSDKVYECGLDAINVSDNFLEDKISTDEAIEKTGNLHDNVKKHIKNNSEKELTIAVYIQEIQLELYDCTYKSDRTTLIEKRNQLAKYLNQKERK